MATGFAYHPDYLKHQTGPIHPENAHRLSNLLAYLKMSTIWGDLAQLDPQPCTEEDLERVHTAEHVAHVRHACERGQSCLDLDTTICRDSYAVAKLAAGGVLVACDAVYDGRLANAFCAVRPPGHHAESNAAMGFCLFNNVAVAARYLQAVHGLERILIVDFDVHHGNGTQEIFYHDGSVFYFSVHQFPHYPGTGSAGERGEGDGKGATLNVPLPPGAGDEEYLKTFTEKLRPAALDFHPDFVLCSAGFDAHWDDPLAGMRITDDGYAAITRIVMEIADTCCQGRIVSTLEGGYNLDSLCRSTAIHIETLMGA